MKIADIKTTQDICTYLTETLQGKEKLPAGWCWWGDISEALKTINPGFRIVNPERSKFFIAYDVAGGESVTLCCVRVHCERKIHRVGDDVMCSFNFHQFETREHCTIAEAEYNALKGTRKYQAEQKKKDKNFTALVTKHGFADITTLVKWIQDNASDEQIEAIRDSL